MTEFPEVQLLLFKRYCPFPEVQEIDKVKEFLNNGYGALYIKSFTKDEAIIFPIAIYHRIGSP